MRGIAIALALAGGALLTLTAACAVALGEYGDFSLTVVLIVMGVIGVVALVAGLGLGRERGEP